MGGIQYDTPYRRVARLLREHIAMGLYEPDEPLPSIEALMRTYSVKRGVIRNALQLLRDEGLIACRSGDGNYPIPDPEKARNIQERRMLEVRKVVYLSGIGVSEIAEKCDVSRFHIGRLLNGRRELTQAWAARIVQAAEEYASQGRQK